jgi:Domain of unknown function (DUF4331)
MSHHFDTKQAKDDPSLNVCDFYLFEGATPGTTVMAMTVNPDAGLSVPDLLHNEGLYAFRFDLNRDSREEVTFKFRFGDPRHAEGDEHIHIQKYQVRRATGSHAVRGGEGELLLEGETGKVQEKSGIRAYVGLAPELFAGDAVAISAFIGGVYKEKRCDSEAFQNRQNYFARRNLTAIVLEVPTKLIGHGMVHAWATSSLYGHAPEVQVQRWGLPLVTHLFLSDPTQPELRAQFNGAVPSEDLDRFSKPMAEFAEKMTTYAGSVVDPVEYGRQIIMRICPTVLPYELGTPAAFDQAGFNGRPLGDDVMDVMITLAANKPLADGVSPDLTRIRKDFPYYGDPYSKDEQVGVKPVPRPANK